MNKLIDELSTLTTIPDKTLIKLEQKILYCICEVVYEDTLAEKELTEIDTGLGTLYFKFVNDELKCKFVPNETLKNAVTDVYKRKLNLMDDALNSSLAKKFTEVYKDLC